MANNKSHIIDPKTIQDVKTFEWIAKKLASGFLHGKHDASRLGIGMEFQQYRPYVSGDDIRGIDWKMYAKTDKLFIKETSIQTEHKYVFLIDNSFSMKYEENGWSKLIYTKLLTAAMMRVLNNQGDHYSWQSGKKMMPMGFGNRHWQHSIESLYLVDFSNNEIKAIPANIKDSTIIWISDFYLPIVEIQNYIKQIKHPKSELILMHILGENEKLLNFGTNATFIDLETKEKIDVNSEKSRKEYQQKLNLHITQLRNISFEFGALYNEVSLNLPISESLRNFYHHYKYAAIQ